MLPGAMFLLGYYDDGTPVMGLPGCVMYAGATIFDLVLPWVAADVSVTKEWIVSLGAVSYTHLDVYKRQTFVSPSTMAWEKATVRRMAVGAGISVIITDICALFSRRAIPVAKSPAPRMITSMENTPSSTDCRPEPDSPSGAPGPWHLPDSTASPPD